ncbi:hypothetical protein QBC40DRAFT_300157 [Triangularia verruculosa]|uniref:Uncharacterized protein n=1 Tax=Triangularia verruculosa TaxID=2587418 RepID=A0AAN6XF27_9PEZI|nr:hypothetical protein QBC40DRAFT_300157 [Triangularia verruculosa]
MPRSPMSPIFNHSNWEIIDIGIDNSNHSVNNTPDMTTSTGIHSGYRYVPANTSHQLQPTPNTADNDDTISHHTDLFPLPPTYSQFHPPYTPSHQLPNYRTFPTFTRTSPNNDSSSDCYSDHLDLDSYLAPSPNAATAPIFPSTNPKKPHHHPRAPSSLTFFPRPTLTPKTTPANTRPVHQSRHLSTLSAKMPLLPLHHQHNHHPKNKKMWSSPLRCLPSFREQQLRAYYNEEIEELEITPSLVQGLDLDSEKQQQQRACHGSRWYVLQFFVMVLFGFLFFGLMFVAGRALWELGWGAVAWFSGREGAAAQRLCSNAQPRFCHLVVGAQR